MVLQERARTFLGAYAFDRFNPFYDSINKMMRNVAAGGIFNMWFLKLYNKQGHLKIDGTEPQVLTMEHLLIGFQICLVPLIASAVVFGLEIASKFMPNMNNTKKFLNHKMLELLKPKQEKHRIKPNAMKKKFDYAKKTQKRRFL